MKKNEKAKKLVHVKLFLKNTPSEIIVQEYPLEKVGATAYRQKDVEFSQWYYEDDMGKIVEDNTYFEIQDLNTSYTKAVSNFIQKYLELYAVDISKVPVSYRVWV